MSSTSIVLQRELDKLAAATSVIGGSGAFSSLPMFNDTLAAGRVILGTSDERTVTNAVEACSDASAYQREFGGHSKLGGRVSQGIRFSGENGVPKYVQPSKVESVKNLLDHRLGPYSRLVFPELPGTREGIAEQKAACLRYLEEYVKQYDTCLATTRQVLAVGVGNSNPRLKASVYKSQVGSGSGAPSSFLWGVDFGKPDQLRTGDVTGVITRRVDLLAARADIEGFYGALMDNIQNEVLDQLVFLHPSVSWRKKPFAVSNIAELASAYTIDLDPMVPWRTESMVNFELFSNLSLDEEWPVEPTDEELSLLLVTKVTWFLDLIRSARGFVSNSEVEAAIESYVRRQAAKAVWAKLESSGLTERALKLVPSLEENLREFLEIGAGNKVDSAMERFAGFNRAFEGALEAGKSYHRGTLVLAVPGHQTHPVKGAIELHKAMGFDEGFFSKKTTGKAYTREFLERLPNLVVCLASGATVVGHPGPIVLQSLVVTAKRYGFNVVLPRAEKTRIQTAIREVRSRKGLDAKLSAAITRAASVPADKEVDFWTKMANISLEMEVSGYGDKSGKSGQGQTFEGVAVRELSPSDNLTFVKQVNTNPVIVSTKLGV